MSRLVKKDVINNPYGYFDSEQNEFVITRPDTPTPWMNYLGEGRYGGIISNTAGGYSFDRDPRNRRVTRYRYNSIPADQPGRYLYLRDQVSGEYWSPTWQPIVNRKLDWYECRHGAGYTRITSIYRGIYASVLYFVPHTSPSGSCPCEIWLLKLSNQDSVRRTIRTFSYVEFSHFDAFNDQHNLDWGQQILFSHYADGVITTTTYFNLATTFFSSNLAPIGFDTDREVFIGNYHDLGNPVVVESGIPQQSLAPRGNNIGSLCHEFNLDSGQELEIIYILGITDDKLAISPTLTLYRHTAEVEKAFTDLRKDWTQYLGSFSVKTPDIEMNAMINFWNPVQCRTTFYWSRFVSAYETGLGRGLGTRDTAQDTLATVQTMPEEARERLSRLWRLQFQDGHTWHQFYPLTGEGGPGLAGEFPQWPQWFSDDHLWLVIAVCAYLRETGDFAYLDQKIPYWDGGEDTVWEHILRAVDFTLTHRGPHRLPRIGFSDWDDTMNIDHGSGKAESVWVGEQFCRAMLDLVELSRFLGKQEEVNRFEGLHAEMAGIVNKTAWDGAWYARAYDDDGQPIGVQSETFHRINLNPQTWAVIGELGESERAGMAMESAHAKLNTPFGMVLMWPGYRGSDPRVRGTSTYPPGAKENGGIFCHAHAWAIVAAAMLGRAELAYQYYRQILPLARKDADLFMTEPYVYCQNIAGPEHPHYGRGRNAWLTGTAAWTYVAGTQWILGIRPTYTGLLIEPVIPEDWQGFTATRIFRNVTFEIHVERKGPGKELTLRVDGVLIRGNVVALPEDGRKVVRVIVTLGN